MSSLTAIVATCAAFALLPPFHTASAEERKPFLTPKQVKAFKTVKTVRIEVKETHVKTEVTLEPDIRRIAKAMLGAAGWQVLPATAQAAHATLKMEVTGGVFQEKGAPNLFEKDSPGPAVARAKVMGKYSLSANRVMLVGRLDGEGTATAAGEEKPSAHDAMLQAFLGSGFLESLSKTLAALRSMPASKALAPLAADEDANIRQYAARVLGHVGEQEGAEALLALLKDNSESVRCEAAAALGLTGSPKALEPLLALIKRPGHGRDERAAIETLGKLQDPRAVIPLIELLASLAKPPRPDAAQSLYRARDVLDELTPGAVPQLAEALRHPDPEVRWDVTQYLSHLPHQDADVQADARGRQALRDHMDTILAALKDKDTRVRSQIVELLGDLGDPRSLAPLKRLAESDPDPRVQAEASAAVTRIRGAQQKTGNKKASDKP